MEQEEEKLFGKDSEDEVDEQAVPHDQTAIDAIDEPPDESFLCEPCGSSEPFIVGPDCGRIPKTLTSPIRPSAADVDKHYVTHLPFRSWCPVCQAAKMREDPHWRARREPERGSQKSGLPIISLDYQEFDADGTPPRPSSVSPRARGLCPEPLGLRGEGRSARGDGGSQSCTCTSSSPSSRCRRAPCDSHPLPELVRRVRSRTRPRRTARAARRTSS